MRTVEVKTKDGSETITDVNYITFEKKFVIVKAKNKSHYFSYRLVDQIIDSKGE